QLVIDAAQLSDRAGNALGVEDIIKTFNITPELILTAPQSSFVGFSGTPVLITTFEIAPNTTLPTQIQNIEISFVMDDGDKDGQNELVRIRTRTGHQILLHNSADLIYIANAKGTAWVELTSNGKIDIFAQDSVSIHT
ncbi:MAG: hypothetical protein ACKPE1_09375, partial [Dolichospermum sp.]